jgi:hypothetical protein
MVLYSLFDKLLISNGVLEAMILEPTETSTNIIH